MAECLDGQGRNGIGCAVPAVQATTTVRRSASANSGARCRPNGSTQPHNNNNNNNNNESKHPTHHSKVQRHHRELHAVNDSRST